MDTDSLNTGDILLCSGKRWLARIIKKFTKSKYSHVAIFARIEGLPYIVDAQRDGVNLRPFNEWVIEYNYDFDVRRPQYEIDNLSFLNKILEKVGNTKYDIGGLILKQPFELITGKWKYRGEEKESSKMYCSEYVAWCYNWENYYKMSPEDVFQMCNNLGFLKIETF